jgi:manganese/zinc/iron transport system permease protein
MAGVSGAFISSTTEHLPTGPTVVLAISAIAGLSLTLAPNRGLLWNWLRQWRNRRRLQVEAVLGNMYALALHHEQMDHAHSTAVLRTMSEGVDRSLEEMAQRGWARQTRADEWALTATGLAEAQRLDRSREASD